MGVHLGDQAAICGKPRKYIRSTATDFQVSGLSEWICFQYLCVKRLHSQVRNRVWYLTQPRQCVLGY